VEIKQRVSSVAMTRPCWLRRAVILLLHRYQIHTDTEWRFFKVVGRVLAAVLTLTACYIHALTIKHAVTPKFWHGFHPKQT